MTRYQITTLCFWLVSEVFWGLHSGGNKETVHQKRSFVRTFALAAIYIAFALIYIPYLSFGLLAIRIVPQNDLFGGVGIVLCAAGISFSIWSRKTLGKNWSGPAAIKKDHELIRNGPYNIVRNPIYLGSLVSLTGSAMTTGELRGLLGVVLVLFSLLKKIDEEELLLQEHFAEFPEYSLRVKRLIPFLY
ncbi:MAG TPA: isoprenylcysteine carboxylmethyltransferase family protein [Bacteroidota bacterium]|nr:isoprenylcysteine carboxylmethyltransferase family protein [Bacteroidota bacterium]